MDTPVNAAAINPFPLEGDDGRAYVNQRVLLGERAAGVTETALLYSSTEDCVELALKVKEGILK